MQISLDKDGWPGFALGGDKELGIWLLDAPTSTVSIGAKASSPEGQSYARLPDGTGNFQIVDNPTPGAANQP